MALGNDSVNRVADAVIQKYMTIRAENAEDEAMNRQTIAGLRDWFSRSDRTITPAVAICISRFVNAELDAETPGRRGMGRMTDDIPRFAGKYREYVKSLGSDERQELIDGFSHLILAAYLMVECFVEAFVGRPMARHPQMADSEVLLYRWIPLIFTTAGSPRFDEIIIRHVGSATHYSGVKDLWGNAFGQVIVAFWKRTGISYGDYEDVVLRYCFDAGIALRMIEAEPLSEDQHNDIVTGGGWSMVKQNPELAKPTAGCLVIVSVLVSGAATTAILFA